MSTTSVAAVPTYRAGMADAIRSEWLKIRTVRSTAWTLLVTLALSMFFGLLFTGDVVTSYNKASYAEQLDFDPASSVSTTLLGFTFVQFAIGVLGTLTMTSEYATGMIRTSLVAVPERNRLLAAKCLVFAGVALVVGQVVSFLSYAVGCVVLASKDVPIAPLDDARVLRAVVGCGLFLALIGVLSVALGALLRATAGAIMTLVVVALIIPVLSDGLPGGLGDWMTKWWPVNAGRQIMQIERESGTFGPWSGLLFLALSVAAVLAATFVVFRGRDA